MADKKKPRELRTWRVTVTREAYVMAETAGDACDPSNWPGGLHWTAIEVTATVLPTLVGASEAAEHPRRPRLVPKPKA